MRWLTLETRRLPRGRLGITATLNVLHFFVKFVKRWTSGMAKTSWCDGPLNRTAQPRRVATVKQYLIMF